MVDVPSFDELPPDKWLTAMHNLRAQFLEEVATVLDVHTTPDDLASALQDLFDDYWSEWSEFEFDEVSAFDSEARPRSVEVQSRNEGVSVWLYPTEEYVELRYTSDGYWWFDRERPETAPRRELHGQVAQALLDLLPWGNEEFIEMVAIELSSTAG